MQQIKDPKTTKQRDRSPAATLPRPPLADLLPTALEKNMMNMVHCANLPTTHTVPPIAVRKTYTSLNTGVIDGIVELGLAPVGDDQLTNCCRISALCKVYGCLP